MYCNVICGMLQHTSADEEMQAEREKAGMVCSFMRCALSANCLLDQASCHGRAMPARMATPNVLKILQQLRTDACYKDPL